MIPSSVSIYHTARCFVDATCTGSEKRNVVLFIDIIISSWIDTRRSIIDEVGVVKLLFLSIVSGWDISGLIGLFIIMQGATPSFIGALLYFWMSAVYHAHPSIPIDSIPMSHYYSIIHSGGMYLFYSSSIQCRIADQMSAMVLTMAHATTTLKR